MAWLTGWSKRKKITLTGGSDGAQTNYQLKLDVTYDSDMQLDFDDLRFTKADGTTLIDAWLESKVDNTSAIVWVEFPTTPANTVTEDYYMYYNNAGGNNWDGAATFDFFDDFSGDLSKYTGGGVDARINTGNLELKSIPSAYPNYLVSIDTFNPNNYALRFSEKANSYTDGFASIGLYYSTSRFGSVNLNPEVGGRPWDWGIWIDSATYGDTGDDGVLSKSIFYTIDLYKTTTTNYQMALDDVVKGNATVTNETSGHKVGFGCWDNEANWRYYVDWICVRKYITNPATYGFGGEETESSGNPNWYYNLLKRRN